MVSNVMLLITVVFGGVLSVGGGVWERLHSVHVMNSSSPEPVWLQYCVTVLHLKSQRGRDEPLTVNIELRLYCYRDESEE